MFLVDLQHLVVVGLGDCVAGGVGNWIRTFSGSDILSFGFKCLLFTILCLKLLGLLCLLDLLGRFDGNVNGVSIKLNIVSKV